jgi:hypothetical protein
MTSTCNRKGKCKKGRCRCTPPITEPDKCYYYFPPRSSTNNKEIEEEKKIKLLMDAAYNRILDLEAKFGPTSSDQPSAELFILAPTNNELKTVTFAIPEHKNQ